MKKLSFFSKMFLGYFLIISSLSALFVFFSFKVIQQYYISSLTTHLNDLSHALSRQLKPFLVTGNMKSIDPLVKSLGQELSTRITIIDPSGRVLADSIEEPARMENHRLRLEVQKALEGRLGTSLRFSTTLRQKMLYLALPVMEGQKVIGVVRVSLFLRNINDFLRGLEKNIFYFAVIIVLFSLLAAYFLSRNFSGPLKLLSDASRKIAQGQFNIRLSPLQESEFREVVESFNHMTSQIGSLFQQISHEKEELDSILSSIQEGVLAIDAQDRIILANESLKKTLGISSPEGKLYWEMVHFPELNDLIETSRKGETGLSREIDFQKSIFFCSLSYLKAKGEIVLVFHDVTEEKRLEKVKKDFVENVSHELRTPLTAIRGFVETLQDNKGKVDIPRSLDVIKRNTDRLISIVEDLLTLSRLENKGQSLEKEKVDLSELLRNLHSLFENKIREKGLKLVVDLDRKAVDIKADPFMIEQMFINLLDNSIKYTDKGEISISVRVQDRSARIEVRDTGIGIPSEHLPRIFERFYVIDKSRSRQSGGTGLGLAIVKHIVLLHFGTIEVESKVGQGTKFIINLPQ